MNGPNGQSREIIKNGSLTHGKPKYQCKNCGRQLVENPQKPPISEETTAILDKMRLERGSLAGIARVTGVSVRWRQNYVNDKYENIPRQVAVSKNRKGRLTIAGDELWSFVGNQDNQPWMGFALD